MRLNGLGCLDSRADWLFHPHLGIDPTLIFALVCPVVDVQQCNRFGALERGEDDGIYCVLIFGILPKASGLWRNNKTLLTATLIWCHVQRFAGHRFHNEAAFMSR